MNLLNQINKFSKIKANKNFYIWTFFTLAFFSILTKNHTDYENFLIKFIPFFCSLIAIYIFKKYKNVILFGFLISLIILMPYIIFLGLNFQGFYDEYESSIFWHEQFQRYLLNWEWIPHFGIMGTPKELLSIGKLDVIIPNAFTFYFGEYGRLIFRLIAYISMFIALDNNLSNRKKDLGNTDFLIIGLLSTVFLFDLRFLYILIYGGYALTIPLATLMLSYLKNRPRNNFHKIIFVLVLVIGPFCSSSVLIIPVYMVSAIAFAITYFLENKSINQSKVFRNILITFICSLTIYTIIMLIDKNIWIDYFPLSERAFRSFSFNIFDSLLMKIKTIIRATIPFMKYNGSGLITFIYLIIYLIGSRFTRIWIRNLFITYLFFIIFLSIFFNFIDLSYRLNQLSLVFHISLIPILTTIRPLKIYLIEYKKIIRRFLLIGLFFSSQIFGNASISLSKTWLDTTSYFEHTNTKLKYKDLKNFYPKGIIESLPRVAGVELNHRNNQLWEAGLDPIGGMKGLWQKETISKIQNNNQKRKLYHRLYLNNEDINEQFIRDFSVSYLAYDKDKYIKKFNKECDFILKSESKVDPNKLKRKKKNFAIFLKKNFVGYENDICLIKTNNKIYPIRIYENYNRNNIFDYNLEPTYTTNKFLYTRKGIKFNLPETKSDKLIVLSVESYPFAKLKCIFTNKKINSYEQLFINKFGLTFNVPGDCKNIEIHFNK